jgi:predicted ABC-type ATPase
MSQDNGPSANPSLYILAGPNGAGKTTFARKFLPEYVESKLFLNADLIAQGIAPFAPEAVAIRAGRLMLEEIDRLANLRSDFAFETTLSGRGYAPLLKRLKAQGYAIHLFYLWLTNAEEAVLRVQKRVSLGGHSIPPDDIRRRYSRGVRNLLTIYRNLVDYWIAYDNSLGEMRIIAYEEKGILSVVDSALFSRFQGSGHDK